MKAKVRVCIYRGKIRVWGQASGQVDGKNLTVRRLEVENAEIRAEMEASRLSASESVTMCLAVAKREKKLLAWEKQRGKLQEDISAEKQKLVELQEEMVKVEAAKKTAEKNWRKGQKAKDYAVAQVERERCLKEATEANNKRNHESLRYKNNLQRLEQELSQIKTSSAPNQQLTDPYLSDLHNETITTLLSELDVCDGKNEIGRACIFCKNDEVSVVFLPCAHQVLCGSCNDEYGKKGNAKCPTCRIVIKQRIRGFGASC